jgi:AraC family transcriptional regulator
MRKDVFQVSESRKVNGHLNHLYGAVLGSRVVAGFILTETAYHPKLKLANHAHPAAYFCFILQGTFSEVYSGRSRTGRTSTLIFHPCGEIHSDHFYSKTRCLNLQIDNRLHEQMKGLNQPADFHAGSLVHLATKLYREFRETDEVSALAIEGLALEMIAATTRSINPSGQTSPPWLSRALELLHDNFAERLTVADIAIAVDVHPVHLAREFRRRYRCAIGEYVRELRVEFARRQISTSDAPLSEIAIAAGFFDQSHFTRTFRLHTGLSPAAYRKTFRHC